MEAVIDCATGTVVVMGRANSSRIVSKGGLATSPAGSTLFGVWCGGSREAHNQ